MLMIDPDRCGVMCRSAARVPWNTPYRWVRIIRSNRSSVKLTRPSSGSISSIRPSMRSSWLATARSNRAGSGGGAMPALLIITSSRPWRSITLSTSRSNASESVTSKTATAPLISSADSRRALLVDVAHDHPGLVTGEPPGEGGTQSGATAGDHHHLGSQ